MKQTNTKKAVFIGMMSAVSTVLMLVNFSIPFAPGFLKFDISELPALFAGFFLGPVSGLVHCFAGRRISGCLKRII